MKHSKRKNRPTEVKRNEMHFAIQLMLKGGPTDKTYEKRKKADRKKVRTSDWN